jgi:hypothetical protein
MIIRTTHFKIFIQNYSYWYFLFSMFNSTARIAIGLVLTYIAD